MKIYHSSHNVHTAILGLKVAGTIVVCIRHLGPIGSPVLLALATSWIQRAPVFMLAAAYSLL